MNILARNLVRVAHRPPPTCLRALSLQHMLTVCMLVRCRSLARTEVRARRHVEHGRTSKLSRSSSTRPQASLRLEVCSRRTVCSRPPCVYAAARMPIHFRHELPALAQVQVARGSAGAKKSRQNQEWPKNGVFRCACRAHTLALGAIRVQRMLACVCVCVPQARRRARQKG